MLATASDREWALVAGAWEVGDTSQLLLHEFAYTLAAMGFDRCSYQPLKKDKDRREGKGRRCCSGDRTDSIPCRPNYCIPHGDDLKNRMILS